MSSGKPVNQKIERQLEEEIPEIVEASVREQEVRIVAVEELMSLHKTEIRGLVDGRVGINGGFEEPTEEQGDEVVYILERKQLTR